MMKALDIRCHFYGDKNGQNEDPLEKRIIKKAFRELFLECFFTSFI